MRERFFGFASGIMDKNNRCLPLFEHCDAELQCSVVNYIDTEQNVEAVNCGRHTTMSASERVPAAISP